MGWLAKFLVGLLVVLGACGDSASRTLTINRTVRCSQEIDEQTDDFAARCVDELRRTAETACDDPKVAAVELTLHAETVQIRRIPARNDRLLGSAPSSTRVSRSTNEVEGDTHVCQDD